MRMPHWLEKRASLTPERIAIISSGEQLTFLELRNRARSLAYKLATLGVNKGMTVALLCKNGLHVPELIHAIHYLGAVLMPLNTRLAARELVFQLRDARSALLLYDDSHSALAIEVQAQLQNIQYVSVASVESTVPAHESAFDWPLQTVINMDAVHTIMYTSGTTGTPKGVMLTYNNHWASAVGSVLNLGLSENDRWLACVPLFHISGLSILMRSVVYGMPIIIHEKFDPDAVNAAIIEDGVTVVSVVSNMLSRMMEALGDRIYPPTFRCMLLGGGPAPLPLLTTCVEKGVPVFQTYGMTETASQIVTLQPEYMLSKLGSAGKPLFQAELRIMLDGKEALPLEAGEIVVRGPNVTAGYLNRPEATIEAIHDGWLSTGDVGYVDEEGFLYVLDRRKDMFVSGGENVYPAEIEAVLAGHPAVLEAGVAGIEDEKWGQTPAAFICLREHASLTEPEVLAYCKDKLAKYKIPSRIYFVDMLPRNASNKLLRKDLAKLIP